MANILTIPESGIFFDGNTAGAGVAPVLTGNASGVAIQYDGYAGVEINSSATGVNYLDRFSVEGANGRLFGVTDEVVGTVFSVNDAAGLPIIEVESTANHDKITIGEYGTDALVVSGSSVQITGSTAATQAWVSSQNYISSQTDDQTLDEVLAQGGTSTRSMSVGTLTASGGGNTLTLKKSSGNPALAFAGTSDQASALIEGIAGGGLKIYTSNGGTLSSPSWSPKITLSAAGDATFSGNVTVGNLFLANSSSRISNGANGEIGFNYNTSATGSLVWYGGGTSSKFSVTNAGNATFAGDVSLGTSKRLYLSGTSLELLHDGSNAIFVNNTGDFKIQNTATDKDIIFRGKDGSSTINALILDMSDAGSATFSHNVALPSGGELDFNGGDVKFVHSSSSLALQGGNLTISKTSPILSIQSTDGGSATLEIGRTADTEAKIVAGDISAGDLNFYTNGTAALKILSNQNATFTGDLTVNGKTVLGNALTDKAIVHGHLGIGHDDYPKIAYPGQNALWSGSGSTTGQIVIDLPGTLANYDMMYMEIDIYEYSTKGATKLIIGGHNWNSGANSNTSTTQWYNVNVQVLGALDKPIYFGRRNDGSNERRCIAIGETNSTWSYATVQVHKVHGAEFYNSGIDWVGDWNIAQTTSGTYFTKNPTTNFNSGTTLETNGNIIANGATFGPTITASNLSLASLNAQNSELTTLMINDSYVVGTRELGTNAFNSTAYLPLAGGTMNSGAAITFTVPTSGGNFININHTGNEAWTIGAQSGTGVDDYLDIGISGGTRAMSWHETGRVGIGTTSPAAKFDVFDPSTTAANTIVAQAIKNYVGGSSMFRVGMNAGSTTADIEMNSGGAGPFRYGSYGEMNIVNNRPSSKINIVNNSSVRATIDSSGNVGIGTTSPARKLHVGTVALGGDSDANADIVSTGGITLNSSARLSFDHAYYVHGNIRYTNSGTSEAKLEYQGYYGHKFITRSGTSSMVIKGDTGNVGIGTTSPQAKLHVGVGHIMLDAGYSLQWDNTHERIEQSDGNLEFFVNNGQRVTINSAGLDVDGIATANTFRTDTSNTDYNVISRNSTSTTLWVQAAQSGSIQGIASFRYGSATVNQGTEVCAIRKNSSYFINTKLGVGTNNPSVTLDVDGPIKHKVYTVSTLPSASPAGQRAFVSDSSYSLSQALGLVTAGSGSNFCPMYSDGTNWRVG